jgi:hypothetical protein
MKRPIGSKNDLAFVFLACPKMPFLPIRKASPLLEYCYAVYVLLNVVIFTATHSRPKTHAELIFELVYEIIAVAGVWTLAILLHRERAQLT